MSVPVHNIVTNELNNLGCLAELRKLLTEPEHNAWDDEDDEIYDKALYIDGNGTLELEFTHKCIPSYREYNRAEALLNGKKVFYKAMTECGFNTNPFTGESYYSDNELLEFVSTGRLPIKHFENVTAWKMHITADLYRVFMSTIFGEAYQHTIDVYSNHGIKNLEVASWAVAHYVNIENGIQDLRLREYCIWSDETFFNNARVATGCVQVGFLLNSDLIPDHTLEEDYDISLYRERLLRRYRDKIRLIDEKIHGSSDPILSALKFADSILTSNKRM